jgi:hypothetical protein
MIFGQILIIYLSMYNYQRSGFLHQGFLKVQGIRHCEAVFAEAIPRYGKVIASTGKKLRLAMTRSFVK